MKHNWPIVQLNEVGSTNIYANSLLAENKTSSETVISAYSQNQGRGQLGTFWESEPGKNLTFSLILFPKYLPVEKLFALTQAVSIAIVKFLQEHNIAARVKWPNDIYVSNNKIAGILIENAILGKSLSHCVIGIGLNVNQGNFGEYLPKAVSMQMLSNKDFLLSELLNELLTHIQITIEQIKRQEFEKLKADYMLKLYRNNEWHSFSTGDFTFTGKIINVKETGELVILSENGKTSDYLFKEIVFM